MTVAYPLQWPEGWTRTSYHRRKSSHNFGSKTYGPLSFERARVQLFEELKRLGARQVVLSTNIPLRGDGMPYAGAALKRMEDPGIAVYFTLRDKPTVMAQDAYTDVAANVRSLALAIDGMRQLERHGGGTMMERAFTGFAALPAPKKWWNVLGLADRPVLERAESVYRSLALAHHPDMEGGDADKFREITEAIAQARKELA